LQHRVLYECLRRNRQRSCSGVRNTIRSLKLSVLHAVLAFFTQGCEPHHPSSHASLLLLLCYLPSACPSVFCKNTSGLCHFSSLRFSQAFAMSLTNWSISRQDAQTLVQRLGTCRTRHCTNLPATNSNFCNIRGLSPIPPA
jgi:hypothetical protein